MTEGPFDRITVRVWRCFRFVDRSSEKAVEPSFFAFRWVGLLPLEGLEPGDVFLRDGRLYDVEEVYRESVQVRAVAEESPLGKAFRSQVTR